MLNPINLGDVFDLAKNQEVHIMSSRKSWKDAANGPIKKTYEDPVTSSSMATKAFHHCQKNLFCANE